MEGGGLLGKAMEQMSEGTVLAEISSEGDPSQDSDLLFGGKQLPYGVGKLLSSK